MSGRPGSTFNKVQKERARQQKQREKLERKRQRKLEKQNPGFVPNDTEDSGSSPLEPEVPVPLADGMAGAE
jgi:hypothetical protein